MLKKNWCLKILICMEIFDFLDNSYFLLLRREVFNFVNFKLIHGMRLLLTSSVNQLKIDKNNNSGLINSKSTKVEILKI